VKLVILLVAYQYYLCSLVTPVSDKSSFLLAVDVIVNLCYGRIYRGRSKQWDAVDYTR